MRKRKRKGYVTLCTTMGDIGLELHCDICPRTCTNFLGLAAQGKYNGTRFHRLIPTFMIQGGRDKADDNSLWGGAFEDEFDDRLVHKGEGILSMANAGTNTNKRQFFITFGNAPHLNRKHSVFGRVVQGMTVLQEMRKVPTDKKDRPVHDISIDRVDVLVDPAQEAEELEQKRLEEAAKDREEREAHRKASALGKKRKSSGTNGSSKSNGNDASSSTPAVGKYLQQQIEKTKNTNKKSRTDKKTEVEDGPAAAAAAAAKPAVPIMHNRMPKPPKKTTFGNFGGW